jgi:hypothetical protein
LVLVEEEEVQLREVHQTFLVQIHLMLLVKQVVHHLLLVLEGQSKQQVDLVDLL